MAPSNGDSCGASRWPPQSPGFPQPWYSGSPGLGGALRDTRFLMRLTTRGEHRVGSAELALKSAEGRFFWLVLGANPSPSLTSHKRHFTLSSLS